MCKFLDKFFRLYQKSTKATSKNSCRAKNGSHRQPTHSKITKKLALSRDKVHQMVDDKKREREGVVNIRVVSSEGTNRKRSRETPHIPLHADVKRRESIYKDRLSAVD